MPLPNVSIVTVNFNSRKFLKKFFSSLYGLNYPKKKLELVMVDNNPIDGSAEYTRRHYPRVKVIRNRQNNYCKANNLGIRGSRGRFVAMVNNDTVVDKNWLVPLVDTLAQDKRVAAAGSKILFMDGKIQSTGHQEFPYHYWADRGFLEDDHQQYDKKEEVSSISNCSALYRRDALEKIGFFDEDFNMYMEDVDILFRLRKKRWKVVYVPQSRIYHRLFGSGQNENERKFMIEKNRLLFVAKHYPRDLSTMVLGTGELPRLGDDRIKSLTQAVFMKLAKLYGKHKGKAIFQKMQESLFRASNYAEHCARTELKQHMSSMQALNKQITIQQSIIAEKDQQFDIQQGAIAERDRRLSVHEGVISEKAGQISSQKEAILQKDREIASFSSNINKLSSQLESLNSQLQNLREQLDIQQVVISEKDKQISSQQEKINQKDRCTNTQEGVISQKDKQISSQKEAILQKDREIASFSSNINKLSSQLESLNSQLQNLREQLDIQQGVISQKDKDLELQQEAITEKERRLSVQEGAISEKDRIIRDQQYTIARIEEEIAKIFASKTYRFIVKPFIWPVFSLIKKVNVFRMRLPRKIPSKSGRKIFVSRFLADSLEAGYLRENRYVVRIINKEPQDAQVMLMFDIWPYKDRFHPQRHYAYISTEITLKPKSATETTLVYDWNDKLTLLVNGQGQPHKDFWLGTMRTQELYTIEAVVSDVKDGRCISKLGLLQKLDK